MPWEDLSGIQQVICSDWSWKLFGELIQPSHRHCTLVLLHEFHFLLWILYLSLHRGFVTARYSKKLIFIYKKNKWQNTCNFEWKTFFFFFCFFENSQSFQQALILKRLELEQWNWSMIRYVRVTAKPEGFRHEVNDARIGIGFS